MIQEAARLIATLVLITSCAVVVPVAPAEPVEPVETAETVERPDPVVPVVPVEQAEKLEIQGRSHFAERDGQRIHVWEKAPADWRATPGKTRVVLFVHGATWSGRPDFDLAIRDYSVMEAFAREGWATYAVDIQGYGASDDPVGENWSEAEDAALDIAAAVDLITELRGVEKVSLVCWSWGCFTGGRFAQAHPDRVDRLVLEGGAYHWRADAPAPEEKFRTNSAAGAASDFIEGCYEKDVVALYVEECLQHDAVSPNGIFRDFTSDAPQLVPARLTMPTMIIQGEHEASPERVRDMLDLFEELATNDKRYLVMPGGGHAILLEKPHRRWQREVRHFLELGDD